MKAFFQKNFEKFKQFMSENKIADQLGNNKEKVRNFIWEYVNNFNTFEKEEKVLRVSGFFDFLSAIIKFTIWFLTGSMAVISSAVDCIADFFTSVLNIVLFRWSKKPWDQKYNYWYGKLQWFGAILQSGFIMLITIFVVYESVQKIIHWLKIRWITLILIVIAFDMILVIANLLYHLKTVKWSKNMIVKSSIAKWFSAFMVDLGILLSFLLIKYIKDHNTNPDNTSFYKIDPVISIIVSIVVIVWLYKVVRSGIDMLMDVSLDNEELDLIDNILTTHSDKILTYQNLKTRKSWDMKFIDFDLVLKNDLSFDEVYTICVEIRDKIISSLEWAQVMINPIPQES